MAPQQQEDCPKKGWCFPQQEQWSRTMPAQSSDPQRPECLCQVELGLQKKIQRPGHSPSKDRDTYPKDTSTHLDICISLCDPPPASFMLYIFLDVAYSSFSPHPTPRHPTIKEKPKVVFPSTWLCNHFSSLIFKAQRLKFPQTGFQCLTAFHHRGPL